MIHHPHSCRQFSRDSIIPIKSVSLNSWVMLKSFEVLFSKSYCNFWSSIATLVWEKKSTSTISNKPVVVHWPMNDTSTPDKQIEGLLEEINQPIEIVLEQVWKDYLSQILKAMKKQLRSYWTREWNIQIEKHPITFDWTTSNTPICNWKLSCWNGSNKHQYYQYM